MNKLLYSLLIYAVIMAAANFHYQSKLFFKFKEHTATTDYSQKVVREVQQSKVVLEETLIKKDADIEQVKQLLDAEKQKNVELSRKLSEKVNESLLSKDDLRKQKAVVAQLEQTIDLQDSQKKEWEDKIHQLQLENGDLQKRIDQLKKAPVTTSPTQVDLPREQPQTEMVPAAATQMITPKTRGVVLNYNQDYNFVVVNLGRYDGLEVGMVLEVFRQDQALARIRVEKLYDQMASGVVLKDLSSSLDVVKGDIVKMVK